MPHARVAKFSFSKITRNDKIEYFFISMQIPSFYVKKQSPKLFIKGHKIGSIADLGNSQTFRVKLKNNILTWNFLNFVHVYKCPNFFLHQKSPRPIVRSLYLSRRRSGYQLDAVDPRRLVGVRRASAVCLGVWATAGAVYLAEDLRLGIMRYDTLQYLRNSAPLSLEIQIVMESWSFPAKFNSVKPVWLKTFKG